VIFVINEIKINHTHHKNQINLSSDKQLMNSTENFNTSAMQNQGNQITQNNYHSDAYKYSELTGKIIGCAMAVHKALGNGFQEVIYQRALEIEMREAAISFIENLKCPFFIVNSK